MDKFAQTAEIVRGVRDQTDTAVLFYSAGGKDGIVLLDILSRFFPKILCYYMYLIPDLDHIRPYLEWAQNRYGAEVRQIPHYQRDIFLRNGIFRGKPDESVVCRKVGDVERSVMEETGIPFAFSGMKGVDGYMKRMRLKMYAQTGYVTKHGMVYPLALWTNKEALRYIESKNLIRPFVYEEGKVSQGFGINLPTMLLMRRRFPSDYEKILQEFPYSEKLIFDYERKQGEASGNACDKTE